MKLKRCKHMRTRCIHGDEIWARAKVRLWYESKVFRQICLDCDKPLDRDAICGVTGRGDLHYWSGPWLNRRAVDKPTGPATVQLRVVQAEESW